MGNRNSARLYLQCGTLARLPYSCLVLCRTVPPLFCVRDTAHYCHAGLFVRQHDWTGMEIIFLFFGESLGAHGLAVIERALVERGDASREFDGKSRQQFPGIKLL